MSKREEKTMAKDLPRYQKIGETDISQDILGGLTLGNPLKKGDKEGTINNIMERMELMVLQDDYKRSQNKNYKPSKEDDDEFNSYKKELKKLGVSFDDFRNWYYNKHPTPEMEAWQKAGDAMNNMFYNILGPSPSQEKKEEKSIAKDLPRYQKIGETEASQNIFGGQLDDIIKKVSPDIKYIKDTEQFKKKSEVDADNHIGPAWENVVYNLNQYQKASPSGSDKLAAANSLNKAVEKYNEMLKKYGSNTSGWPMNDKGEYRWQDYERYIDNRYDQPIQYKYTVGGDKANAILNGGTYEKQEFKFKSKDGADLIKQINKLEKRYNELEELEKKVWPKWNSLKEQGKGDTKEAKQYLNQRFEYDNEKTKIINSMRQAEDDYRNLVDNYSKDGK